MSGFLNEYPLFLKEIQKKQQKFYAAFRYIKSAPKN